jgi:hypothetical protein
MESENAARAPQNPVPEAIESLRPLRDRLAHLNEIAQGIINKVQNQPATAETTDTAVRPSNGPGYAAQLMDLRSDFVEGLDSLESRLTILRDYL